MQQADYLARLYANRFNPRERQAKNKLWQVLIQNFLQAHVGRDAVVLDIAGGYGEFINHVQASKKFLIDLNPDAKEFANDDVTVLHIDVLNARQRDSVPFDLDRIFVSNFFEHLHSKEELMNVLQFCFEHLRPGGCLLIIQPNFKYSYREYYDFIDHHLPITHLSLVEVLHAVGFEIKTLIPRFLPFSTKGRPSSPMLLQLYLKLPIAWSILGAQMFIKAAKPLQSGLAR